VCKASKETRNGSTGESKKGTDRMRGCDHFYESWVSRKPHRRSAEGMAIGRRTIDRFLEWGGKKAYRTTRQIEIVGIKSVKESMVKEKLTKKEDREFVLIYIPLIYSKRSAKSKP